jgi:hypothetical protein
MYKSDIGNYLKRIGATYRGQFLEHTNTIGSEHSSEVNEPHNPTQKGLFVLTHDIGRIANP